jgi:hypothetical protein
MLPHWAPWEFIDIPERGHDQPTALILDQTRKRGVTGFLRENGIFIVLQPSWCSINPFTTQQLLRF